MQQLAQFLKARGFDVPVSDSIFGDFIRFDRGGTLNGWLKAKRVKVRDQDILIASFGDWKTGEIHHFKSDNLQDLSADEKAPIEAELAKAAEEEKQARAALQEEVAQECLQIWESALTRGHTAYMTRKQVATLGPAKIDGDHPDTLLVPAFDIDGRLWSIQKIFPTGEKRFKKNGRKQGCFAAFGQLNGEVFYVCEGYATGASIAAALDYRAPVIIAFDSGNLLPVGRVLRDRFPDVRIVFCADDDRYNERRPSANTGLKSAQGAATLLKGEIRLPRFVSLETRPTDFNDLHCLEGLAKVREQLQDEVKFEEAAPAPSTALDEKKKKLSEKLVSEWLLESLSGRVVRQDDSLFSYDGQKWCEMTNPMLDQLRNRINTFCGDKLSSKEVMSIYRTFVRYVPVVPTEHNLFEPRPDRANFLNGTLHLRFRPKTPEEISAAPGAGTYAFSMEFRPHSPLDYCTNVLPLNYAPVDSLPENGDFEAMLNRIWPEGDADQSDKIWLYKELLGAALVPLFPKIFFFVGAPKSGKSTLLALVRKLLGKENTSSVDPSRWGKEFQLEPMMNKLGNIHEDISTTRLIDDSIMKSIIDGLPLAVNRKGQKVVQAKLPALHAFGCNDMPRSLEGGSGAYDRRALIIRTTTPQAGSGGGGEFSTWIWERGPEGILRAALQGLERLLANGGRFTIPASSADELKEWALESDYVAQFLEAVHHGEVGVGKQRLLVSEHASIVKGALYDQFCEFVMKQTHGHYAISHKAFTKRLRQEKHFCEGRDMAARYWRGIGFLDNEAGSQM